MTRTTRLRGAFRHLILHVGRAREEALAGKKDEAVEQLLFTIFTAKVLITALEKNYDPELVCNCDYVARGLIDDGRPNRSAA